MLARLRNWLFDGGGPENLPERVRETIRQQQERSEILIGWAELVLVGLLALAYETTTMAARRGAGRVIRSKPRSSILYGVFSIVRLILAYRRPLPEWLLYLSVIADMALLMGLIYFYPLQVRPAGRLLSEGADAALRLPVHRACARCASRRAS